MPTQAELAPVAERHAAEQRALAEQVALMVLAYYLLVDEGDLSGTGGPWLRRAVAAVAAGYRQSALLSDAFSQTTRRLHLPGEDRLVVPRPAPNLEKITASLTFVGLRATAMELARPTEVRKAQDDDRMGRAEDVAEALRLLEQARASTGRQATSPVMERAAVRAAGATMRQVTDGGREMVDALVAADRKATGYVRITQEGCCYFCALLASRGPVYKDDSFDRSDPRWESNDGSGSHKVHDFCRCTMQPVYSRSYTEWPDASLRFNKMWLQSGYNFGSKKNLSIRRFRALYEGREMPDD